MLLMQLVPRFIGGLLLTLVIAIGFGTGFLVISYRVSLGVAFIARTAIHNPTFLVPPKADASLTFGDGIRLLFRPLLMVLGEFDFNTLYEEHEKNGDLASLFYASFLLLLVALVGSFVLVNLILALILSDVGHLYAMCRRKELFRKARQVVFFEKLSKIFCCTCKSGNLGKTTNKVLEVCAHKQCHCGPHRCSTC